LHAFGSGVVSSYVTKFDKADLPSQDWNNVLDVHGAAADARPIECITLSTLNPNVQ